MASRRNFYFGNGAVQERNRADNVTKGPEARSVRHTSNPFMSSGNVHFLEQFVDFCIAKKIDLHKEPAEALNGFRHYQEKAVADSTSFREDLKMQFGDQLPANVVEQLCKLVQDSSHGKCSSCMLPTESLIISVLQILSNAAKIENDLKENIVIPPTVNPNVRVVKDLPTHCSQQVTMRDAQIANDLKENSAALRTIDPNVIANDIHGETLVKDSATHYSQHFIMRSSQGFPQPNKCTGIENHVSSGDRKNVNSSISHKMGHRPQNSGEASHLLHCFQTNKPMLVLDTPLVMHQGNRLVHELASMPANVPVMNKKPKIEAVMNQSCNARNALFGNSGIVKECVVQAKVSADVEVVGARSFRDRCLDLGKSTDELYNKRNFSAKQVRAVTDISDDIQEGAKVRVTADRAQKNIVPGQRFPISDEEQGLYDIICGLAHSQWSCFKAVEFSKTSVTYSSLGESVEPGGKVDNFFMSVMCRKFFEDVHPRQSKKHFFYLNIGGCLYTYNCSYDIKTVQKSFLGANSAYKIHLSHKLCFPVVLHKHWFVFIVDLKNKLYVFLDSYFDGNHNFQIDASTKLINAFKECWHQYAAGNIDLEEFTISYPPVPKQNNVVDCGIFAIKFMELWDRDIDLRHIFDQSDIANIRVKLAVELFFSKWNCLDKSLVKNLYQQGINPRVCN